MQTAAVKIKSRASWFFLSLNTQLCGRTIFLRTAGSFLLKYTERRIRFLLRQIFDGMGVEKLSFLTADFVLNVLAVAYKQNPQFGYDLIKTHPIDILINESFKRNLLCASERILHLQYFSSHYKDLFPLLEICKIPKIDDISRGKRRQFIIQYGINPFDFNTWL